MMFDKGGKSYVGIDVDAIIFWAVFILGVVIGVSGTLVFLGATA